MHSSAIKNMIEQEREKLQTASLSLKTDETNIQSGKDFAVRVTLANSDHGSIDSVRSWLSFDPSKLQVVKLDDTTSDFELSIPQEHDFDNQQGLISLGRSLLKKEHGDTITVQTIIFSVQPGQKAGRTAIDFFDFNETNESHAAVYRVVGARSENILKKPELPGLLLEISS